MASKPSGVPSASVIARVKIAPYSIPHAIVCHTGSPASWLRCAAMLESAESTTEAAVKNAPSATCRSVFRCENSGQKTSVMPAIPSSAPPATRAVMGVPKKSRMPTMLRSGLAEYPTATSPDTTYCSA